MKRFKFFRKMSHPRVIAINRAMALGEVIFFHLLYLLFYKDVNGLHRHWQMEIKAALDSINRLRIKPSNKKLKFKTIYECIFEGLFLPYDPKEEKKWIKSIEWKENKTIERNVDLEKKTALLDELFQEISYDLSKDTYVWNKYSQRLEKIVG